MLNSLFGLMLTMYLISFYLVFGFDEWFLVWLGLELNMISFLVLGYKSKDVLLVEGMGSYFFIQSLASGGILAMVYLSWVDLVWVGMLSLKMGIGPFYFWYIRVVRSFTWVMNFVLMVFQKVILLLLLSEVVSFFLWLMGLMSLLVGVFGVVGQVNLKLIMGYSSIHHGGWMLCLLTVESLMWGVYLLCYGLMMFSVIVLMAYMKSYLVVGGSMKIKSSLILAILNLGGIPPLMGFMLKWVSFYMLMYQDFLLLVFLLVVSVGMLYVYLRLVYDVAMMGSMGSVWYSESSFIWSTGKMVGLVGFFLFLVSSLILWSFKK